MVQQARTVASEIRERVGDVTRQRILDVARELFSRRGFYRTTMKDIADRLDISDPALYYHFHSKRHILRELMVEPELAIPDRIPVCRQDVADSIFEAFCSYATATDLVRTILRQQLAGDPASLEFRRQASQSYYSTYGPVIRQLYGARGDLIAEALNNILIGALWDGVLVYGREFTAVVTQATYRERIRRLIDIALPAEAVGATESGA